MCFYLCIHLKTAGIKQLNNSALQKNNQPTALEMRWYNDSSRKWRQSRFINLRKNKKNLDIVNLIKKINKVLAF